MDVKKSIALAMSFDESDRIQEAYHEYLKCIELLMGTLTTTVYVSKESSITQLFRMASHCLDRALHLSKSVSLLTPLSNPTTALPITSPNPPSVVMLESANVSVTTNHDNMVSSSPLVEPLVLSTPSQSYANQPNTYYRNVSSPLHTISPMLNAQERNRQLIKEHQSCILQLSISSSVESNNCNGSRDCGGGTGTEVPKKRSIENFNLSLYRKMAENAAIAKRKKESIDVKLAERQLRLANVSMKTKPLTADRTDNEVLLNAREFERLRDSSGGIIAGVVAAAATVRDSLSATIPSPSTEAIMRIVAIRRKLANAAEEVERAGSSDAIAIATAMDEFANAISEMVRIITEINEHPVSKVLYQSQYVLITTYGASHTELSMDEARLHERNELRLKMVVQDIRLCFQRVTGLLVALFPIISSVGDNEDGVFDVALALESIAFPPIHPILFRLYTTVYKAKEEILASRMVTYRNMTPKDLKMRKRFWLTIESDDGQAADIWTLGVTSSESLPTPYAAPILEFKKVDSCVTPQQALDCIVNTCRMICECVVEFWRLRGLPDIEKGANFVAMGSDDVLTSLHYVVLKSAVPNLYSHSALLQEFINERAIMVQEGYCLASLQTVLEAICSQDPNGLDE